MLNLTQHPATMDQLKAGVVDLPEEDREVLKELLTFEALPSKREIAMHAKTVARLASSTGAEEAMIGGAPFLMTALEQELRNLDIEPRYAFSVRDSQELSMPDGSIKKINVFKHVGFI